MINSIEGFIKSLIIGIFILILGGKYVTKTIQNVLRLVDLWFNYGFDNNVNELITKKFDQINVDVWLLIVPQLFARINIQEYSINKSLMDLLIKIANVHPQALIFPYFLSIK